MLLPFVSCVLVCFCFRSLYAMLCSVYTLPSQHPTLWEYSEYVVIDDEKYEETFLYYVKTAGKPLNIKWHTTAFKP